MTRWRVRACGNAGESFITRPLDLTVLLVRMRE